MSKWKEFWTKPRHLWGTKKEARTVAKPEKEETQQPIHDRTRDPSQEKSNGWLTRLNPNSKRDQQIAELRKGYGELLKLITSIRTHLDKQGPLQEEAVKSLNKIPESLRNLDGLSANTQKQTEVLDMLRRKLEMSDNHDRKLIDSMDKFNHTLTVMDESSRNTSQTITQMLNKTRESERLVREEVRRSEKKMLFLTITLTILVMLIIGLATLLFLDMI